MTKRSGIITVAAVLLACASPAAIAANPNTNVNTIRTDQVRANKMIGAAVYDRDNVKIGSVQDLVLNRDGRVADVVIDVGSFLGMGGKNVAVPFDEIKSDHNRLTLDRTKDQLKQMAEYRLQNKNTGAGTTQSPVHGGRLGTAGSSEPSRR